MKLYLTGASGLVGSAFAVAAARRGHHVVGTVGGYAGTLAGLAHQITLDLTISEQVTRSVLEIFPDVIVNCAAASEPAACDADPIRSDAMNVALPTRLAELAHHLGARVIHVSSEQVFDGARSAAYAETDTVSPINLYGRQKAASERSVLAGAPDRAVVVRAPLLMGDSPTGRRGLHERLFADWANGRTPRLYTDEFRQPCTARNLAEVLLELTERPEVNGCFHWAGVELLSRFELGVRIRTHFKLAEEVAPIEAIPRSDTPAISSRRPPCLALDTNSLAARLKSRRETLAEQLATLRVPVPQREWYLKQR